MSVWFSLRCLLLSSFASLHRFSSVYGGSNLAEPAPTPINRDLYHSSAGLMEEIKSLVHRHPDKLSIETVKTANNGYEAEITTDTYCKSRKDSDDKSKFRILLSFGQHGSELITTELALRILSILSEEQFLPKLNRAALVSILDRVIIKVVPMEYLHGRELVEAGDLCERRNGRGVDLNRNWGVDWGKKEKDYDPHEENPGAAPFSENRIRFVRNLMLPKADKEENIILKCRLCDYQELVNEDRSEGKQHAQKTPQVPSDVAADPTLPRATRLHS